MVTPTDIPALLVRIPECHALVTTGEKASTIVAATFGCEIPPIGNQIELNINRPGRTAGTICFWRMPSTSRAYPLPLEKKADAYRQLFPTASA